MHQESASDFTLYTKKDYFHFISRYTDKKNSIEANLLAHDSVDYVSNVTSCMAAIGLDEEAWSVSVNEGDGTTALICSPYVTYVKYPQDIMGKFNKFWVRALFSTLLSVVQLLCKATKIDQVAQVNNNLNSLLKHSRRFIARLPNLTELLIRHYPQHSILFFRVNGDLDKPLLKGLRKNGYILFPDRAAHLFYPGSGYMKRSYPKRDRALLRNTRYKVVSHDELTQEDGARICELYQMLFIKKHSQFNPVYTEEYFRQAIKHRWHQYVALRNPEGSIDAFISWFYQDSVMICGPLGHDIRVDQKVGLYRMVFALALKQAHDNNSVFNMGAGTDQFKLNRGSEKVLEYTAVYCKHLPFYRRIPWRLLQGACNAVLHWLFKKDWL